MKNHREKVEFHPQRPNRSKSRTKFSPYQPNHSQDKFTSVARQNREKLTLKQPIIKVKELMNGNAQKNKLAITSDKPYFQPNLVSATSFSNCNFHSPFQTIQNLQFSDLAAKIDQQSQVIEQYFSQLNKKLKLPRIEPYEQKNEKQAQKQKQAHKLILQELQQLKVISSQNAHLRQIILRYERESQFYRKKMESWQQESEILLQKISALQNNIKMLQSEKQQQKEAQRIFLNEMQSKSSIKLSKEYMKISKQSITKEDEKFVQTEKEIKNQLVLIENLKKEIENLKLQNQMLTEEVKLLNYSLNQRDSEIEKLKKRKSILGSPLEKSQPKKSSICEQLSFFQKPAHELEPKQVQSIKGIEQKEMDNADMNSRIRNGKKTKSFIVEPTTELKQKLSLKPRRSEMYSSAKRRCSIDQKMLSQGLMKILSSYQTPSLKKSITSQSKYKVNHERLNAEIDKRKMTFAKSILKINGKNSKAQLKQSDKKTRKDFIHFNAQKIAGLQRVRKTIGARWRVLRYSFQELQMQLMERKSTKINQKQMVEYLQVFPFFLNVELIQQVVRYILRADFKEDDQSQEWPQVEIDVFCNCLRQFIPQTTQIEQQQEMVLLQKIRNVVLTKSISLLEQLRCAQFEQGMIGESQMRVVLQQFKLSQAEIELIIGQCCLISLDIQHLSYEKYFSFFNASQQFQN